MSIWSVELLQNSAVYNVHNKLIDSCQLSLLSQTSCSTTEQEEDFPKSIVTFALLQRGDRNIVPFTFPVPKHAIQGDVKKTTSTLHKLFCRLSTLADSQTASARFAKNQVVDELRVCKKNNAISVIVVLKEVHCRTRTDRADLVQTMLAKMLMSYLTGKIDSYTDSTKSHRLTLFMFGWMTNIACCIFDANVVGHMETIFLHNVKALSVAQCNREKQKTCLQQTSKKDILKQQFGAIFCCNYFLVLALTGSVELTKLLHFCAYGSTMLRDLIHFRRHTQLTPINAELLKSIDAVLQLLPAKFQEQFVAQEKEATKGLNAVDLESVKKQVLIRDNHKHLAQSFLLIDCFCGFLQKCQMMQRNFEKPVFLFSVCMQDLHHDQILLHSGGKIMVATHNIDHEHNGHDNETHSNDNLTKRQFQSILQLKHWLKHCAAHFATDTEQELYFLVSLNVNNIGFVCFDAQPSLRFYNDGELLLYFGFHSHYFRGTMTGRTAQVREKMRRFASSFGSAKLNRGVVDIALIQQLRSIGIQYVHGYKI